VTRAGELPLLGMVHLQDGTLYVEDHIARVKTAKGQSLAISRYANRLGKEHPTWLHIEVKIQE
jgi:hypothetical protein